MMPDNESDLFEFWRALILHVLPHPADLTTRSVSLTKIYDHSF